MIKIEEDVNDKKTIKGYNCHKVIVYFLQDGIEDPEFGFTIHSMYVTDQIKLHFHPVVRHKSILKKYYPIEVTEVVQIMRGAERKYILKKLNI